MLLQKQPSKLLHVVVSKASSKNNWVVLNVLLLVSNSKSATKTILFEFIFVFYLLLTKYALFLSYAWYLFKIHIQPFVIMYVQSLLIKGVFYERRFT